MNRIFSAHWQIIPNIAVDLILPALMHVFSPFTAGRIVLGLCLFLPVSGAIALSCAYFGRRSLWQLTPAFAGFNVLFLMGFMNFAISLGISMWGAAAWIRYRERRPWLVICSGMAVALLAFFFHLIGFFCYALLVGCYEWFAILDVRLRAGNEPTTVAERACLAVIHFCYPLACICFRPWIR